MLESGWATCEGSVVLVDRWDVIGFRFVVSPVHDAVPGEDGSRPFGGDAKLEFLINGRSLLELVREHERPLAAADGQPGLEGTYEPLSFRRAPRDLLYGDPSFQYARGDGRTTLIGCGCGVVECWPLVARIDVTSDEVVWHRFAQPFRRWSYDTFGPFRFERVRYDGAVEDLDRRLRAEARFPAGWAAYLHRLSVSSVTGNLRMFQARLLALRSVDVLPLDAMRAKPRNDVDAYRKLADQIGELLRVEPLTARVIAAMDPDQMPMLSIERHEAIVAALSGLLEIIARDASDDETAYARWLDVNRRAQKIHDGGGIAS